jgi:anaphase-promoting complex subunit 3
VLIPGYGPDLDDIFPDPPAPSKPVSRTTQSQPTRPPTLSPNPMPRSSASEMPGFLPGRKQLSPLAGSGGGGGGGGFFTPDVAAPAAKLGMRGQQTWE